MAIGRLPAGSVAEVQTMVAKIEAYEDAPADAWQNNTLWVADDETLHTSISDAWSAQVPLGFDVQKLYATSYPSGAALKQAIAAGFNASGSNPGAFLATYMGHGNVDRWSSLASNWGTFFTATDVNGLTNGAKLPFVLTADCLNGFFVHPFNQLTMAETVLRRASGGGIAAWSPTALGSPGDQSALFSYLYPALLSGNATTLGAATLQAQSEGYNRHLPAELLRSFTLFGDPAVRIRRGQPIVVSDLAAIGTGASVTLTWSELGGSVDHYEVWRGRTPHFAPSGAEATLLAANVARGAIVADPVTFTDETSHVGDPVTNDYYVVLAVSASGRKSVVSNRAGEFDFAIK
jgi:hypothetical protein